MVPGQIGLVQATEVLKLVLKIGKPLVGKLFIYGALNSSFDVFTVEKNPSCPLCGNEPSIKAPALDNGTADDICSI